MLTPDVQRFIQARPALKAGVDAVGGALDGTVGAAARAVGGAVAPLAATIADSIFWYVVKSSVKFETIPTATNWVHNTG